MMWKLLIESNGSIESIESIEYMCIIKFVADRVLEGTYFEL